MRGIKEVDNSQKVIDSRDVIERIEYLSYLDDEEATDENEGERGELKALRALAEEGEASPDWPYGEALIRDSYFTEYAQELADDIGAIKADAGWPLSYIDWDAAAEALKQDYMSVDFQGVEYWIRA